MLENELWPALRHYWLAASLADRVADKPVGVTVLDERLVLVRLGGRVSCFKDICMHRGTPLSLGWIDDGQIVCAYHGWSYEADGRCSRIPALPPGRAIPPAARLQAYRCEERYGMVWVCLGEPKADIPEFPEYGDQTFASYIVGPYTFKCSAARAMENFVDQAHFPWVHAGFLGSRDHPETATFDINRHGDELRFNYEDLPNPIHPVRHRRIYRMYRPFSIHQRKIRDDGGVEVDFYSVTPHSARESTHYVYVMLNYQTDHESVSKRKEDDILILMQDKPIVESQRPEELPLDLSAELHIKGPDAVSVAYRRFMAELGVE